MLTKKGKYGLKAMTYLAQYPPGHRVSAVEIALTQNIPAKFLQAILTHLRVAGFVETKKGRGGGYTLARPASEITVGEIMRAIDGPLAPLACLDTTTHKRCDDCLGVAGCLVRIIMKRAQRVLDECSLQRLLDMAGVT